MYVGEQVWPASLVVVAGTVYTVYTGIVQTPLAGSAGHWEYGCLLLRWWNGCEASRQVLSYFLRHGFRLTPQNSFHFSAQLITTCGHCSYTVKERWTGRPYSSSHFWKCLDCIWCSVTCWRCAYEEQLCKDHIPHNTCGNCVLNGKRLAPICEAWCVLHILVIYVE